MTPSRRTPIFHLDAFATRRFAGNPAAVMPMASFADDATLQALAAENNLSETAFLVPAGGDYRLRWFTPRVEVPLCGHATLASAAVVMERLEPTRRRVTFHTASGPLMVTRTDTGASTVNWANFTGTALSVGLSNAYYPSRSRNLNATAINWGSSAAGVGFGNLFPEFLPDFKRMLKRLHL